MVADILIQGKDFAVQQAGPASAWTNEMPQYARRIEVRTVGSITTIYKAWASYGSVESASVWMVQKLTLDTTTELDVTDGLAGGVAGAFSFTWSGRAGHTYA